MLLGLHSLQVVMMTPRKLSGLTEVPWFPICKTGLMLLCHPGYSENKYAKNCEVSGYRGKCGCIDMYCEETDIHDLTLNSELCRIGRNTFDFC